MTDTDSSSRDSGGTEVKPDKGNIRKWVEALRSGRFKQVQKQLVARLPGTDEIGYCCLGVACEVAIENGVPVERGYTLGALRTHSYDGETTALPRSVRKWLGVNEGNPLIKVGFSHQVDAVSANDVFHWTFEDIADAVEKLYLREEDGD